MGARPGTDCPGALLLLGYSSLTDWPVYTIGLAAPGQSVPGRKGKLAVVGCSFELHRVKDVRHSMRNLRYATHLGGFGGFK